MGFWEYIADLNPVTIAIRLVLATLFGGVIGLERGKQGRAAGMRTHILVCIGSALTSMMGIYAYETLQYPGDPMRIAAQVISGIGFLGVGTILLKGRFQITGLTTAAGLWATATIGIATGIGFYEGSIIAFIVAILTVTVFHRIEARFSKRATRYGIYVEVNSDKLVRTAINHLIENYKATDIQVTSPRSGTANNVGIEANIHNSANKLTPNLLAAELEKLEYVIFAIESI